MYAGMCGTLNLGPWWSQLGPALYTMGLRRTPAIHGDTWTDAKPLGTHALLIMNVMRQAKRLAFWPIAGVSFT